MKIWVDDIRPAPEGYVWCKRVNDAKECIIFAEEQFSKRNEVFYDCNIFAIELIDLDHDAGEYAQYGGDYIELLNWLEETGRNYPIRIHSMNPVGRGNMRRIIRKNGWTEVD